MFSPSGRSSSPFPFTNLDMWDTKSRFTTQTSAWSGMAAVSGSGFLSQVNTSSAGGFRPNDPGLRRWQSLSHLGPERATRSFTPPAAELRAVRGENSFRQAEVVHWLQDAHERLDTQLDRLKTREMQLGYNMATAQLLDMKHKQLTEVMSTLEQEKEAAELSQFERNQLSGELHEKVIKMEKDLLQMRSTLDRNNDQPTERAPGSFSRTSPLKQEDFNRQEKQRVDMELCRLREALREAEAIAQIQGEERNKALQHLQTSNETQRTLLNQIEEMNKRLSNTSQNQSEVQQQLSEANNKISQACLDKAMLSTQVLKLEDTIKELNGKLKEALTDKDHLMQNKTDLHRDHLANAESHNNKQEQETVLMTEDSKNFTEVNEKLRGELEVIKQRLETSQCQLQELREEKNMNSKQITDLEVQCSQLLKEKEELLSTINEGKDQGLTEMKENCCQHRELMEILELENQKLQDQFLCLEDEVLEKEKMLHLQEEEHHKQDAVRVQSIEGLKAVVSHWTDKWQKVALTLQSTQEELEEFKKNNSRIEVEKLQKDGNNHREPDSLLKAQLDACKQELESERSRSQALPNRYKDKGGEVHTEDKETMANLSFMLREPPSDSQSLQNKSPQLCIQSTEVERLRQKLAEGEKELSEKEHALKSLERLREMEKTEAQIKISALELQLMKKFSEYSQNDGNMLADDSITDSLRDQLEESRMRVNQLQQEKTTAVQKLQALRQLYSVKDEKPSVEDRKDKAVCPENVETDQQRRLVTEQLKNLFKEREGKEAGKVDNASSAQTGASSTPEWTPPLTAVRAAGDRRNWQQGSGLMPVFEEDEEDEENWPGNEEGEPAEETDAQETLSNQRHQMSAEISNQKANSDSLLQALKFVQPSQDHHSAEKVSDKSISHGSDECDPQWMKTPPLYPDGIFLAELVGICSSDEEAGEATEGFL